MYYIARLNQIYYPGQSRYFVSSDFYLATSYLPILPGALLKVGNKRNHFADGQLEIAIRRIQKNFMIGKN
jgi:hypothetical protein